MSLPKKCISSITSFKERNVILKECALKEQVAERQKEPLVFEVRGFVLRRQLGQGAGGRVFLGCHSQDKGQKAAIKVVNKRQANAKAVRMARREHSILGELPTHPHIVELYHVVENGDRLCLIMQFAEGGDLFDYVLKCGKLPLPEAWRIFRQLLSAVNHMHRFGFMHRDIKPENVFLDKNRNVLLGDFGLGGKWSSLAPTNATCGSLNYAAPEILQADYYIGPEVDIWSCGAVLYMMLTGSVPFSANSRVEVFSNIKNANFHTPAHWSPEMKDLLRQLLNPNALKRAKMSDLLEHPWVLHCPVRVRSRSAPLLGKPREREEEAAQAERKEP